MSSSYFVCQDEQANGGPESKLPGPYPRQRRETRAGACSTTWSGDSS